MSAYEYRGYQRGARAHSRARRRKVAERYAYADTKSNGKPRAQSARLHYEKGRRRAQRVNKRKRSADFGVGRERDRTEHTAHCRARQFGYRRSFPKKRFYRSNVHYGEYQ